MVIERLDAAGTERNQSLSTLGIFLGGDIGKSSVHMILSVGCGTCCNHGTCYQECASALIHILLCGSGSSLPGSIFETYSILLTCFQAVKAIHASAVVNPVVLGIYATGLTSAAAFAAVYAFALINDWTHQ